MGYGLWILTLFSLMLVWVPTDIRRSHAAKKGPPTADQKLPIVAVEPIKKVELFDLLTYPARLVPKINASILSESEGVVKKVFTPIGTPVKKGQMIARILNTDPVYNYAPVAVRASVAGIVSAIDVTEGSRVTKGQRLAQITDPRFIKIMVEVAVADLSAIHKDLRGTLFLQGVSEKIAVKVVGVSPYVDPGTGTATAELALVETDGSISLPPGLVGKVNFKARNHKGFQLPEHAVFYQGKDPFVRVIEEGKAKFLPVKLGPTRQGLVEILDGVKEEQDVVIRTSTYVADGEEVQVRGPKGRG